MHLIVAMVLFHILNVLITFLCPDEPSLQEILVVARPLLGRQLCDFNLIFRQIVFGTPLHKELSGTNLRHLSFEVLKIGQQLLRKAVIVRIGKFI